MLWQKFRIKYASVRNSESKTPLMIVSVGNLPFLSSVPSGQCENPSHRYQSCFPQSRLYRGRMGFIQEPSSHIKHGSVSADVSFSGNPKSEKKNKKNKKKKQTRNQVTVN